jgi:SAM-dependent methyltransferase
MDSPPGERINEQFWRAGGQVAEYANRRLLPAEVIMLARYRDPLAGRVLEVGCGAGRILGYLVQLGGEVHGIDVSPAMVEYCRLVYPGAIVRVGDLGDLGASVDGRFDAVVGADNVLDVFDDAARRRVLGDLHRALAPDGLLVFSSHNLAYAQAISRSTRKAGGFMTVVSGLLRRPPAATAQLVPRLLRRRRNRRRLGRLEHWDADHAVLNDSAHDYSLLHYYIRAEQQVRQLAAAGYELVEALETDGTPVPEGRDGFGPSLYYVARARS